MFSFLNKGLNSVTSYFSNQEEISETPNFHDDCKEGSILVPELEDKKYLTNNEHKVEHCFTTTVKSQDGQIASRPRLQIDRDILKLQALLKLEQEQNKTKDPEVSILSSNHSNEENHTILESIYLNTPNSSSEHKYTEIIDESDPLKIEEIVEGVGTITLLESIIPKGAIDDIYFFDKDEPTIYNLGLVKGDQVEFVAKKIKGEFQWVVSSIKLVPSQKEIERDEIRKHVSIIGRIVEFDKDGRFAYVRYGQDDFDEVEEVDVKDLPKDYVSWVGDYLKLSFELNDPNEESSGGKLVSALPPIRKTLIGKITLSHQGRGGSRVKSIDKSIYFSESVYKGPYGAHVGQTVLVEAIECSIQDFNWRAISVTPSASLGGRNVDETWTSAEMDTANSKEINLKFEDDFGIKITPGKFISFESVRVGSSLTKLIQIENSAESQHCLKKVNLKNDQSIAQISFEWQFDSDNVLRDNNSEYAIIQPSTTFSIKVSCAPKFRGKTREIVVFEFGDFEIWRYLTISALASDESQILKELQLTQDGFKQVKSEEERISKIKDESDSTVMKGALPVRAPFFIQSRIPNFAIPKYLWSIIEKEDEEEFYRKHPKIMDELNIQNYLSVFETCLWLEEMENQIIRRKHDLENVVLKSASYGECYYKFEVPDIKDISPPLSIGDLILVHLPGLAKFEKYEGIISDIRQTSVYVKLTQQFAYKFKGTNVVNIEFKISRTTFRRCHHAVDLAIRYLGEDWLFPPHDIECKTARIIFYEEEEEGSDDTINTNESADNFENHEENKPKKGIFNKSQNGLKGNCDSQELNFNMLQDRRAPSMRDKFKSDTKGPSESKKPLQLKWFNKKLNREQKNAVRRVLRGQGRPLPYVIFGPPGTGKTVTVVESMMQVYFLDKNSRSLVVAPSNSAADVIASLLISSSRFKIGDFVRLNGFKRHCSGSGGGGVDDFSSDGEFLDVVARHRLIITTCTTAGQFYSLGLNTGHFTHVFIDEAGYCTEPEALIAATLVALDKKGQVILAGDPKQLGPVLMSDVAVKCGLSLSFLERIMSLPLYSRNKEMFKEDKYNPLVLTKLTRNYRAHSLLLNLPSKLFYDDELEACAHQNETNLCLSLKFMNLKPILFHGIEGVSAKDPDSPSWYNIEEAFEVLEYVRMCRASGIANEDIGIITPYRKQVEKLRRILEIGLLSDEVPKIGSVEEFQGGERRVIVLSLVRSTESYKNLHKVIDKYSFVFSPKRFNVAITRAKGVLIAIGNPHTLLHDSNWLVFIKYCIELHAYTGCKLPRELLSLNNK